VAEKGNTMLSYDRLTELLDRFARLQVAVLGDFCLDAYWHADMIRSELSRETPHFPLPVVRETYSPGGAGNVAANLRALGAGTVHALTVLGDDWRGAVLRSELDRLGVRLDRVVITPGRVTPAYVKPIRRGYGSEQEDPRLDFQNFDPLPPALEDALIAAVRDSLATVAAVVVVDQLDSGVITDRVRAAGISLAGTHPDRVFVADSRQRIGHFQGMIVKPNELELLRALRSSAAPTGLSLTEIGQLGRELAARIGRPAFVTVGAAGALLCTADRVEHLPAAPVTPPLDIVGAGDTFLAALVLALAAGATLAEAGAVANLAAAVVVEKLNQTGTASPAEVMARHRQATS
jgi:rfaE bifunctional protein kinase chain/domain